MITLYRWCLLLAWMAALFPSLSTAQVLPGFLRPALPEAALVGGGAFRWFGLKLYDARLWAERRTITPDNWAAGSFALELVYARRLVGEKIAASSIDEMKKLGIGTPAQHAAWLEAMKAIFPDVEDGTQLVGVYAPGQASRFFRDGRPIGEVADPEFGKAFFAIWLHPKTSAPKLRAFLFGQAP